MEEENVKKHIHQIIGITDDERVLAECNLIEEILNKEDKLSQYYKQKERIDKAIEYIRNNCILSDEWTDLGFCNFVPTGNIKYKQLSFKKVKELLDILEGEENE